MNIHTFTISHTQEGIVFGMSSTGKGEASAQAKQRLQEDFEQTEMKINDAYMSNTHHIAIEDNPAYGQHTPHISTEDNVAYGQTALQIPMEYDTEYAVVDNFGDLTSRQDQYDYEEI